MGKWKKDKGGSYIWRGICDSKDILTEATKWIVGNGATTSLWEDWWCDKGNFKDTWGYNDNLDDTVMVNSLINQRGE